MLYGVIDVGSNSVRLMMHNGIKTLNKKVKITALAENMGKQRILVAEAINRTVLAIKEFVEYAKECGVDKIYAFATAAVRYAENKQDFVNRVKQLAGIELEVVSGEVEAELGYKGALKDNDGGVIDIGGASAEVVAVQNGVKTYSNSLNVGVVKIKDECGQNKDSVIKFCNEKIKAYGTIPKTDFYAIGGTATSLASILLELEPYDPDKVNGYKIYIDELEQLVEKLFSMSIEQREMLKGLQPERTKVIAGGAMLMFLIMKKIGLRYVTVSESDNLEGYIISKLEKL